MQNLIKIGLRAWAGRIPSLSALVPLVFVLFVCDLKFSMAQSAFSAMQVPYIHESTPQNINLGEG